MAQKIVRVSEVSLPDGKIFGWQPMIENGQFVGIENPRFGRFEHVAFVDADTNAFLYDGIRKLDGPIQEDGHATPGAIMIVVEEKEDGFYLYCQEEGRPIIFDHINGVQGVKIIGFAGGFSKKGQKPSQAALEELLEEQGVLVDESSVEFIGYSSDNRATTETCFEVYLGKFRRQTEAHSEEHEIVLKTLLVRIDEFKPGLDGIVNSAYAMVVNHLGLVRSK